MIAIFKLAVKVKKKIWELLKRLGNTDKCLFYFSGTDRAVEYRRELFSVIKI